MRSSEGNEAGRSLFVKFGDHTDLLELPGAGPLLKVLSFFGLVPEDAVDLLAPGHLLRVEVVDLVLHLQFDLEPFLLEPFLVGQPFGQVVPLELGQVLQVPQVLGVEVALRAYHLLPIQRQGCQLSHPLVRKLDPPFPETYLLVSAFLYPILPVQSFSGSR